MALSPGSRLGPYEIVSALGVGGMGEVYRAKDPRLGRELAIKVLPVELSADRERLHRLEQEARSASALNHPNIVTIYEIGQVESTVYISMELVRGKTLREVLAAGPLPVRKVIHLGAQIADGLSKAHEAGIVHRDLKPENLMVSEDGFVKILDFGLAKVAESSSRGVSEMTTMVDAQTHPGQVLGTVGYMSPEQASGRPLDFRSDQFSFGSILYEMVTGQRAFLRSTAAETLAAIIRDEPSPVEEASPSVPDPLARIIRRCLSKEPAERYASTRDLAHDLRSLPELTASAATSARKVPGAKRRPNFALAAVLGLIVLAGVAVAVLTLRKPSREIGSLAVLPFANAGGDPNMEFLSDGVTESLINSLSQLPGLKVISRTSAFTYKGRGTDPKTVGKELGVRAVLVGSIARRGEDLAISAELVDTSDNSHLWGDQYNRKMSQIFAMQDEISQEIASALRLKLKGEENARLTRRYTNDTEAYQLYLKGRYHWNLFTEEGLKTAIRYYNEAIAKDPTYALAYTGLAASYGVLGANYWAPREAHPKSKAAIDRALEIDPSLPEAQGVLGAYELFYEWDWAAADKALRRAIAADPGNAGLYQLYSYYLWTAGRLEQALSNMQRAVELDPLSPVISGDLAWTHYFARQYDRAIEQFLKSQDLGPNYYFSYIALGFAYVQKGMFEEIIAMIRKGVPLAGESSQSLSYLGYAYGAANRVQEAKDVLRKLHEISRERYVSPYDIAMVYTGLGDKDQAFEWLDKAYQDRYTWLITLKVDPIFDSLRSDPRFTDLVRRVGLP